MRNTKLVGMVLSVFVIVTACPSCCAVFAPHLEQPYSNPPATFQDADLVGVWEAHYMEWGQDKLILKADGTFKQIYQDCTLEGYIYETPWNDWSVEYFPDGRVRLHMEGARYYLAGIKIAELSGRSSPNSESPFFFYDPVTEESLTMIGELVLNVRRDSSGEIVLLHMWTDFDRGVAVIGGEAEEFRRIKTESSLPTPLIP